MVCLILSEVREKEEQVKDEGVDFFQDLVDPSNEDFIQYFQLREDAQEED